MKISSIGAALTFLGLVGATFPALAQSASTTGTGSITVIRPISLTKTSDMKFGTVVRPPTGSGTVVLTTAGVRSVTGGVGAVTAGDAPVAATFSVAGEGGQSVSITVPATITMISGADSLTVTTSNNLTGSPSAQTLSNALGSVGSLAFSIGGSVPISSTQATGAYVGSFTVSAAYN